MRLVRGRTLRSLLPMRTLPLLVLLALLAGCGAPRPAWVQTDLYLGLGRADGSVVGADEFQAFLDDAVTPRFPDGLTVIEARGQWRSAGGVLREPARVLVVVHPPDPATDAALEAIRADYRRRFAQESVLRVDRPVSASF